MTKDVTKPHIRLDVHYDSVLGDISNVIDEARKSAARSINSIMTAAYWLIGRRIVEYEQGVSRAQNMEAASSKDFQPIWQAFMAAASELIISSVSAPFTSLILQAGFTQPCRVNPALGKAIRNTR